MNTIIGWVAALMGAAIIAAGVQNISFFTEFRKTFSDPLGSVAPPKKQAFIGPPQPTAQPSALTSGAVAAAGEAVLV